MARFGLGSILPQAPKNAVHCVDCGRRLAVIRYGGMSEIDGEFCGLCRPDEYAGDGICRPCYLRLHWKHDPRAPHVDAARIAATDKVCRTFADAVEGVREKYAYGGKAYTREYRRLEDEQNRAISVINARPCQCNGCRGGVPQLPRY